MTLQHLCVSVFKGFKLWFGFQSHITPLPPNARCRADCHFTERGCSYVTVLREPLARLFSHYDYLQRIHPDHLSRMCKKECK